MATPTNGCVPLLGRFPWVDLIQQIAGRTVFNFVEVPRHSAVSSQGLFSDSVLSLELLGRLGSCHVLKASSSSAPSVVECFRASCERLDLHLHAGKKVVKVSSAAILGADLDGNRGTAGTPILGVQHPRVAPPSSMVRYSAPSLYGPLFLRSRV